jgi:5,5'-dehydrodivanillate O-demethylase oxygenase subunit
MLGKEANERLTKVGPGTDMGELMRRYWMPIAGVSEFNQGNPIRPIRLLGEDLVLYRDKSGTLGLIDKHCPHRRGDLTYGFVENCGLRCNYHGWLFKEDGACIEQPYEDTANPKANFKDKITIKSYPVEVKAGLIWAYMGPLPAPLLPNWEPFAWTNGFVQIAIAEVPCNWLQCQENSIDPVHFEWMHVNWSRRQMSPDSEHGPKHLQVAFEEFEHGFVYKRQRDDLPRDHPMWTVGRVCLWPNGFFLGDHFEWRVPIDDENTLSIAWMFGRVPREAEPYVQHEIPTWRSEIVDPKTGRWISTHVMNQDFIAWVGQGTVADRTQEHLGTSDRGIVQLRKRYVSEMAAIAEGRDPKGVIRDPTANACVRLPIADREILVDGLPLEEMRRHPAYGPSLDAFVWQAGQPPEVWLQYRRAMGLPETEVKNDVIGLG